MIDIYISLKDKQNKKKFNNSCLGECSYSIAGIFRLIHFYICATANGRKQVQQMQNTKKKHKYESKLLLCWSRILIIHNNFEL